MIEIKHYSHQQLLKEHLDRSDVLVEEEQQIYREIKMGVFDNTMRRLIDVITRSQEECVYHNTDPYSELRIGEYKFRLSNFVGSLLERRNVPPMQVV